MSKGILKRLLSLTVAAVLMVFAVTGCSDNVKITTGLKDTVIFKLSDSECALPEIMLTLINEKNKYEKDFGTDIWEKNIDGKTMEDSVKSYIKDRQIYLEAISMMAEDKDVEVTDEENKKLEAAAKSYYDTLTDEEKENLNVTEEDVLSVYRKSLMAEKVYNRITEDVVYEVSDEEARVMSVMYIYISTSDGEKEEKKSRAEEIFDKVKGGADFYTLAAEYSDDKIVQMEIGREDMLENMEKAVFALKTGEYTDIIETEKGYYIVKCVEDYLPDRTESNKNKILLKVRNEEFLKEFEPFLDKQKLDFNNKVWDKIAFKDYEYTKTDSLFDVYTEYIGNQAN